MTPDKPVTLAVAMLCSVLCAMLPRRYAIVPLCVAMCTYPTNLLLPPDGMGLTAQRVIALVLIIRCLSNLDIRSQFRWGLVDTVAAAYFLSSTVAQAMNPNAEGSHWIVNRGGFFLSAMVPFWCVRMLIIDRDSFFAMLKGWLWACPFLALNGLYFVMEWDTPYYRLMEHGQFWFGPQIMARDQRVLWGQMRPRAHAPFQQCIMYGWFFALWLVPCLTLFWQKRRFFPWIFAWIFMPLGIVVSISAGPNALAALSLGFLALFPFRKYWKVGAWTGGGMYVALLLFSDRAPLEILASYGMDQNSSWYRVGLARFTLDYGGIYGVHWLVGFGCVPHHYDRFHDLCIQWVGLLVVHGLIGVVGFYGTFAVCAYQLWVAKKKAASLDDEVILWSLFATISGVLLGLSVVSLFSDMQYIFHMYLGVLAAAPKLVGQAAQSRQVGLLAEYNGQPVLLRYTLAPGQGLAIVTPR